MQLGICVASKIDDIDYLVRAEALDRKSTRLNSSH